MSTDAHTPVPIRPSEEERERVVRLLRDRSVDGRLSTDTFADRVGLAYRAKSSAELAELTSDVRPARGPRRLLLEAVEWLSRLDADLEAAWKRPRIPSLALPGREGVRLVNGVRVLESVEIRPGDRLNLGGAAYAVRARRGAAR